ncbi:MAG: MFS transporter [Chloroflexi bacterium]|nr:MFS transporter [Chloroflexota bacterium]
MNINALDKLPARVKFMYGIGDTGFSLTSTLIGAYFLLFLTDVVGLRPALAGAAIMVAKQWDWINDPIVGYISDRTNTRWGKRRPFLLFGFIPYGLTFALMWWKPPVESQIGMAIYFGAVYVLYDTAATFVYMPYFALTPELTRDYDERTALTSYRMAFSILGSLIAFTVPLIIIGSFRPENAGRVWWNGVLFAILSAMPLLLTFWGTRERYTTTTSAGPLTLRSSVKAALQNRLFLFGVGLFLATWLAISIVEAVFLYYIRYYLRLEGSSDAIMACVFVVAILALPLWEWTSRHSNKRRAYIVGVTFWAVVQIVLVLLRPSPPTALVLALAAMAGVGVSAAHVLPWAIIPDAMEWDELQTGQRHTGTFYSIVMLMQKASAGLALLGIGLGLEWSGYVPNADVQPLSALTAIRGFVGPVPAMLLCLGILLAALYPLGREEHLATRQELLRRGMVDAGANGR